MQGLTGVQVHVIVQNCADMEDCTVWGSQPELGLGNAIEDLSPQMTCQQKQASVSHCSSETGVACIHTLSSHVRLSSCSINSTQLDLCGRAELLVKLISTKERLHVGMWQ